MYPDLDIEQTLDVLVMFKPAKASQAPRWFKLWHRYLAKSGYGHVVTAWFANQVPCWVIMEAGTSRLQIRHLPASFEVSDILRLVEPHDWTTMHTRPSLLFRRQPRGLLTCVSVAKALLGVGGWSVTPWQLRCQLRALGS